eukprot:2978443-Alexandrium_andersonii.AAC.1
MPGSAQFQVRTLAAILQFGKADCRLGRIAALTSMGRIADCTLGALQFRDPSRPRTEGSCPRPGIRPKLQAPGPSLGSA